MIGRWMGYRHQQAEQRIHAALAYTPNCWHSSTELMRRARLTSGRYYVALAAMEDRGEVEAMWEPLAGATGYHRRLYRLVSQG